MTKQKNKTQANYDSMEKLLKHIITLIENRKNTTSMDYETGGINIVEDNIPSTYPKDKFFQMVYDDVVSLKRESVALAEQSINHGKSLKSIELDIKSIVSKMDIFNDVKSLPSRIDAIEKEIKDIRENMPSSFKKWIEAKAKLVTGITTVAKFVFWTIMFLFIISKAFPNLFSFANNILK